ncbi:MAG: M23 family metallopeptidase [Polyangiaceae bacterium]
MSSQPGGPRLVGRVVDPLVGDSGETEPVFSAAEADAAPASRPQGEPEAPQGRVSDGPPAETRQVSLPPLDLPPAPRSVPSDVSEVAAPSTADFGGEEEPYGNESALEEPDADIPEPTPTPVARGGAMRELLLAKAREADPERARQLELESRDGGLDEIGRDFSPPTNPLERELDEIGLEGPSSRSVPAIVRSKDGVSPTWLAVFATGFGVAIVAALIFVLIHVAPRKFPSDVEPAAAVVDAGPAQLAATDEQQERPKRVKLPGPWRIADDKDKPGMQVIEGEIGRDPFLKAIQDAGLEKAQAYRALTALKDLRDLEKCDRSDRFVALIERGSKRLKAFEYEVSKEEVYQAKEDSAGLLRGSKLDLKVDRAQVKGAIRITGAGLDVDAKHAGLEAGLASVVSKALKGQMSIEQFEKGDVLKVVAQEVTVLGEFARYAGVEALEYIPQGKGDKAVRIYYFRGSRSKGYYDDKGRAPGEGYWRRPIPGAPVTSNFNPNRMHPVLHKRMPHTGTDFGAGTGTPIRASSYGTVKFIGVAGRAGNLVMIKHDNDYETGYAHMSRFAQGLKVGDRVEREQVIGYVGSTGSATGPHLHFICKHKGKFVDAMKTLKFDALQVLPSGERAEFEEFKKPYDALFAEIKMPPALAEPEADAPAASSSEASDGSDEGEDPSDEGSSSGLPESDVMIKPTAAPAASGGQRGVDLSKSVNMSDEDLLKAQPATDDGEVE